MVVEEPITMGEVRLSRSNWVGVGNQRLYASVEVREVAPRSILLLMTSNVKGSSAREVVESAGRHSRGPVARCCCWWFKRALRRQRTTRASQIDAMALLRRD